MQMTKITLLLISSLTIMSIITISPGLPDMAAAFPEVENISFLVKLVLTIPALFIAIIAPVAGRFIDRKGRLGLLSGALITYAVAGTAGFYLENLFHILLSRIVLGISVGITMTIVITLVADYFEGKERQKFVGIQVAFMSLAGIIFIGVGGVLADISWKLPFILYSLALLVLPLSLLFLDEPNASPQVQRDISQLKAPRLLWLLFFNTMVMWILFFLIPAQIPFYLNALGIEQSALIGAAIAVATTFSAVSAFSFSRLKNTLSFSAILSLGYVLMAIAFFCISAATGYGLVLVAMMLAGLGIGMMIPNTNMWVMKIAPIEIRGREIGKLTTFWFFGQFLSPIVVAPLLGFTSLTSVFLIAAVLLGILSIAFILFHYYSNED